MAVQYNFLKPIDQKVRDQGYDFVSRDEFLQDGFKPTSDISYEGDGSPVSYANSMGGIMSQAPIPGPLKYIPPNDGGGRDDDDDDDDDENKTYDGPSMSPIDAVKNAGMFMLNPLGYLATKAFGAYRKHRQRKKADNITEQASGLTDRENITKIQNYTGKKLSNYRMSRPASERNFTGGGPQANDPIGGFENTSGMGRTGYFFGGRVNYKAGGRTDAGPNRSTASKAGVGQINEAGNKVDGGNYNDGGDNNPSFYETKPSFFNNPEILNKETIFGDIPTGIGFDNSYGRYKATMDLEESLKEEGLKGELEYNNNIGDFNFGGKYDTQDGSTYGASYNNNGLGVDYNNIDGLKASYEKGPFSLSTDGKNSMFNFTMPLGKKNGGRIGFKNGGLASIL